MNYLTSWIQGIIVAVVIATIIEMILPDGNSKKYIKIVIGIYIIFNIITPIIDKFAGTEFSLDSIIDISKYEQEKSLYEIDTNKLENNNQSNVKEIYILNLKKDIKAKIEDKGYMVNSVYVDVEDNDEYTIKNIKLVVHKKESNKEENNQVNSINVEKVNIQIEISNMESEVDETETNTLTSKEKEEIKKHISSTYEVNEKNIEID